MCAADGTSRCDPLTAGEEGFVRGKLSFSCPFYGESDSSIDVSADARVAINALATGAT